jgi:hypothetical protein
MIRLHNNFDFGQIVYLKSDTMQLPRLVNAMQLAGDSTAPIMYRLCQETDETWHYEVEISAEKDVMMTTTN